ncbi:FAD-binding oxidoreductase [Aspergillus homomorphus CBS 101889]|uniref:FAD-binding domain-containing protein n=1 Tax=Aspergillus homomorphus (strain CBS 101889) TaxID=1450537 RepID=A0A395HTP3_ASPHC|nr:FAD-binding domain-containing protein [Aspergillus homomorphus CBS 101889]RAL09584.1 FAD-binding domain-containing protein [Aspergillus homomorphus CBS 101889]
MMHSVSLFSLWVAPALALAPAATPLSASITGRADPLIQCLSSSLSPNGSIIFPDQPLFTVDTARYSELYAPTFRLISKVENEHDVRVSIQCAKSTNTTFLLTGPRHGFYQGFQKIRAGLEIDTSAFNEVTIDPEANTLTCGGATIFQQVIDVAYAAKKDMPTGSGSCVGVLGAGVGAGIGRLEGLYGLIIDSLLSVRIMLPNTTVVEASTEQNPDLFWGIRGAGWNFGFILNATFRVYDQVPNGLHLNADLIYPSNITESFYEILRQEAPHMPAPLSLASGLAWNPAYNDTTLTINAVYAGPEREGRAAIQFLLDQGPILRQNITMVPWNQLIPATFFGAGADPTCSLGGVRKSVLSSAFNVIDPKAQVAITEMFKEMVIRYPQTGDSGLALYFPATQAARAISSNETAYAWRDVLGHMNFEIVYSDNTTTDATIDYIPEKMRDTIAATAGTDGLQVYVGFSHGDEPLESIFAKDKLPHLAALKKQYDPEGLFNAYHPLPTVYP